MASRPIIGPVLPTAGPSLPSSSSTKPLGPASGHDAADIAHRNRYDDDDSDDDGDVVGPALPPGPSAGLLHDQESGKMSYAEQAFMEREKMKREAEATAEAASQAAASSRPDWMLAPPPSSSLASMLAPNGSAMKARGFQQNTRVQRSGGSGGAEDEGMSLWTETPQQRLERLKGEVTGAAGPSTTEAAEQQRQEEFARQRAVRRDADIKHRIADINSTSGGERGMSLLEQHQAKRKDEYRKGKSGSRTLSQSVAETASDDESEDQRRRRRRREQEDRESRRGGDRDSERHRRRNREGESHRHRGSTRRSRSRSPRASTGRSGERREDRYHRSERLSDTKRSRRHRSTSPRSRSSSRSRSRSPRREQDADSRRRREHRSRRHHSRSEDHKSKERKEDRHARKSEKKATDEASAKRKDEGSGTGASTMIWDREKAMSFIPLMDERKRDKVLGDARALGDRFGGSTASSRFL